MLEDVYVLGLVMGTHLIEDIQMDIPHGITVAIPAEKAHRSKDLWKAMSQRQIIKVYHPNFTAHKPVDVPPTELEALREQIRVLTDNNVKLTQELNLLSKETKPDARLDTILDLLKSGALSQPATMSPPAKARKVAQAEASEIRDEAPTFIPSTIKPTNVDESRIDTKKAESSDSGVSDAGAALRKMRKEK